MIGLVTVLFKCDEMLEGFFKSLSIQTYRDFYLIMVDNSVNDQTNELVQELAFKYSIPSFIHIQNDGNYGVARGNNQGIKESLARGTTHTLLLNNDIEFNQPNALDQMVTVAIEKKKTLVIPKIYYFGTNTIWMAGGHLKSWKGFTIHEGEDKEDVGQFDVEKYFDYAPTCFMLINNNVFKSVGLMDEKYFVYFDDTDFIFRTTQVGNQVFYYPEVSIYHKVSSSTGGNDSPFTSYYANRNRIYFIRKNYRGFKRYVTLGYSLLTRVVKLTNVNQVNRANIIRSLQDGLGM